MFMTLLRRHTLNVCTDFCIYGKTKHITTIRYQLDVSRGSNFKFTV